MVARFLLEEAQKKNVNLIDTPDRDGRTPLMHAVVEGMVKVKEVEGRKRGRRERKRDGEGERERERSRYHHQGNTDTDRSKERGK